MLFKDRLKKLREDKHVTQKELADAIYVSRSAVAKWENGLGIPNEESYKALCGYFGVTPEVFPLNEEIETEFVDKNELIRNLIALLIILILTVPLALGCMAFMLNPRLWPEFTFSFTSQGAAGSWKDEPCIHTEDYDFYCLRVSEEPDPIISFIVVKKLPIGWKMLTDACDEPYYREIFTPDGTRIGRVYSYEGKHGWYHIFHSSAIWNRQSDLQIMSPDIYTPDGERIELFRDSYFETPDGQFEFRYQGQVCTIE